MNKKIVTSCLVLPFLGLLAACNTGGTSSSASSASSSLPSSSTPSSSESSASSEESSITSEESSVSSEESSVSSEESSSEVSSETGPITIADATALAAIANDLTGEYALSADFTVSLADWVPLGNALLPFSGSLVGEGHTITLTGAPSVAPFDILNEGTEETPSYEAKGYAGLFGYVTGTLSGFDVTANTVEATLEYTEETVVSAATVYAGLIAGVNAGTISDVAVSGTSLAIGSTTAGVKLGGAVGQSLGAMNQISAAIAVTASSSAAKATAGGVLGEMESQTATLSLAKNTAAVQAISSSSGEYQAYAGGIVGAFQGGTISDVYSSGAVYASIAGAKPAYAGGIIGTLDNEEATLTLTNAYAKGTVTSETTTTSKPYAGGIAGRYEDKTGIGSSAVTIANVLADNNIYGTTLSSTKVDLGTILGKADTTGITLTNAFYTGSVTINSGKSQDGAGTSLGSAITLDSVTVAGMGWNDAYWTLQGDIISLNF